MPGAFHWYEFSLQTKRDSNILTIMLLKQALQIALALTLSALLIVMPEC